MNNALTTNRFLPLQAHVLVVVGDVKILCTTDISVCAAAQ